jgi:predicted AlkP superfamily phosphohydrolase/phosphomutase
MPKAAAKAKIILLGIDGFDPKILADLMGQGDLPNFSNLAAQGFFSPLETVFPPQSPTVWTSIATGCTPSEHGIFDFVTRSPAEYLPKLTILRQGKIGYQRPYQPKTFWEIAGENNIPATILKWPVTFPATPLYGQILSGLGTPDIQGTLGRYTLFTTKKIEDKGGKKGNINFVRIAGSLIKTELLGPYTFSFHGAKPVSVPLEIELFSGAVSCRVGNASFSLAEGSWSDWVQVQFKVGFLRTVKGMYRFFLESVEPDFSLYITPPNISCENQNFPICYPLDYAKKLAGSIGSYATLGLAEDANALRDEVIGERCFLLGCDALMKERERIFFHALQDFQKGILACVFDTPDRMQHMFWRYLNPDHPLYNEEEAQIFGPVIPAIYKRMDAILGNTLEKMNRDTLIIICSDHGFTSFQWAVHLNTWLVQNGFMSLKNGHTASGELFQNVDWSGTTAFAMGLNSIFLNIKGREGHGILEPDTLAGVRENLTRAFEAWTHQGRSVVKSIYFPSYPEGFDSQYPDLLVGYNDGYRASWQTALGGAPQGECIQKNLEKWSGDHCCEPSLVPGIFLTNEKNLLSKPHVQEICPAILDYFGL